MALRRSTKMAAASACTSYWRCSNMASPPTVTSLLPTAPVLSSVAAVAEFTSFW